MKPAALILFLITFVLSVVTHAQAIYGITDDKNVVKISADACSSEVILNAEDLNPDPGTPISDIAWEQGVLYCSLSSSICSINPENGSVKLVSATMLDINGLAGDENGHLYIAGSQLSKYTIFTNTLEVIGSLYPYYTSGDVEYVNGILYITAHDNGGSYLLKVQTNPFSFSVFTSIPNSSYGLVKSPQNPGELYVTDLTNIYSINLSNGFVLPVCNSVFGIYGLTSGPEDLIPPEYIAEFPNIFSPNGDQKNDLFTWGTGNKEGSITIVNRWGNTVFHSDLPFSWDGKTSDGKECTEGVYYYLFESESESKSGTLHLLR
nr:gliding motility-associated C-terminal domain-containing protein [uncultured Fluviicola sp.]